MIPDSVLLKQGCLEELKPGIPLKFLPSRRHRHPYRHLKRLQQLHQLPDEVPFQGLRSVWAKKNASFSDFSPNFAAPFEFLTSNKGN
jgi:hypothetical protein